MRIKVAHFLDLVEGELLPVDVEQWERPLLLCRTDGQIYCVEDTCSHRVYPLRDGSLQGHQLQCPLHGATFDIRTGEATGFPAFRCINTFPVTIDENDDIFVDIEIIPPDKIRIDISKLF